MMNWLSPLSASLAAFALTVAASAGLTPSTAFAQGQTLAIVVHDPGDQVWLRDSTGIKGPASLTGQAGVYQALFPNAAPASRDGPRIDRYIQVRHHYDRSVLGRARFLPLFCDALCAGNVTVTIQLPYYTFAKPSGQFQLDLGDLSQQACGTTTIVPSTSEQASPQSYYLERLLGWWSAFKDCKANGQLLTPTAIDDLGQALASANWLVLHAPDRYAIDSTMQDDASTVLESSLFCAGPQVHASCVELKRQLLKSRVVEAAILKMVPRPPGDQLHQILQTLYLAKGKLDACASSDDVRLNVCADISAFAATPGALASVWCADVRHDPEAEAICYSLGQARNPLPSRQ